MTLKLPEDRAADPAVELLQVADAARAAQPEPSALLAGLPEAAPADPFDGADTFTGERENVAGLSSMLGKIGAKLGKAASDAATPAAPIAAEVPKPVVPKPAAAKPPAARLPVLQPYDEPRARQLADKPTELPPNSRRTDLRNFNMKKLQTPDDIKALIDDVARDNDGFMTARRGVVSNAQTDAEAQLVPIEQLLGRQPAQAWNAAQIRAGQQVLLETGQRIVNMKNAWKAGAATSDEDLLAFRQLLAQHAAVQEQLSGAAAEAGRALQIFNAVTAPAGKLRAREVRDALQNMGGRDATERLMMALDDLGDEPGAVARVARKTALRRTADAISEWTINSMLSGPATHMANISGNVLAMALHPVERTGAALVGKTLGAVSSHTPTVQLGEAAQMFGVAQGVKDGFRLAWRAIKDGDGATGYQGKTESFAPAITAANFNLDESGLFGKSLDLFGEWYVRLPGKALAAQDEFFKSVAGRMELNARAYRQAVEEGASGPDLARRTAELVNDTPDELLGDAYQFARYSTFTNSLWDGQGLLSKVGRAGQSIFADHPIAKLVIAPFIRTPINIAKYIVERSPLELVSPDFYAAMRRGGADRELAIARVGLGSLVATAMMSEYFTGDDNGNVTRRITGAGPDDPGARAALLATGWQPNSILLDGQYVSYNRADPFGAIVGMYANALDILEYAADDDEADDVGAAVVLGTAEALMSKSYLSSLSEFFDVLTQRPDASLTSFVAGQAGKPMPAWLGTVARATDTDAAGNPVVRDTRVGGALDQVLKTIKARTPGLAADLPPKRDLWGQPVVRGGRVSVLTPFPVSEAKDDRLTARLIELDAVPPKLSKIVTHEGHTVDLVELDDGAGWIWDRYQEAAGQYARQRLEELDVENIELGDEAQIENVRDAVRDTYRNAKRLALVAAVAQYAGLLERGAPLPSVAELTALSEHAGPDALGDKLKKKPPGSRRLPPHLQGTPKPAAVAE